MRVFPATVSILLLLVWTIALQHSSSTTRSTFRMEQQGEIKVHRLEQDQELRFEVGKEEVVFEMVEGESEIFGMPLGLYKKFPMQPGIIITIAFA